MSSRHQQQGFILIFSLTMISLLILIVTGLFNRGVMHLLIDQTVLYREKARTLCVSGIDIAMSQLQTKVATKDKTPAKKDVPGEQQKASEQTALLFKVLMPALNHWQTITLSEKEDGIDATIALCISCEDGKININELFDFTTKKFKGEGQPEGDMKKLVQYIFNQLKPFVSNKDLFGIFEKFLKQRQYKVDDVTELLRIKEFQAAFNTTIFYEPPQKGTVDEKKGRKRPVFLTDVFTTWSSSAHINAWVLSDSCAALLGFIRADAQSIEERTKITQEALKTGAFKSASLEQIWPKALQKLYGKEFSALSKDIKSQLYAQFNPEVFSIIVKATVGTITQNLCAIIERHSENQECVMFTIKRIFWI